MERNVNKTKTEYTKKEIEILKKLIRMRVDANRDDQKKIRGAMRKLGFYGSKFGIHDCQVSDLEGLIRIGIIKVIDDDTSLASPVSRTPRSIVTSKVASAPIPSTLAPIEAKNVEMALIYGNFVAVNTLRDYSVPNVPGLYCIKLRKGVPLPQKFGKVREDGIIYIGKASKSLKKRLLEQELNHKSAATFFRSMGAILGFMPPKGSLYGKSTRNYKFSLEDTEVIKKWMRQSLLVNWITLGKEHIDKVEKYLICKYCPLVNIDNNPAASDELKAARKYCVEYAKSK